MTTIQDISSAAKAFAAAHPLDLAKDLNEWQDTGLLPQGCLRQLAEILEPMDAMRNLSIAEHYAERAIRDALIRRFA